MFVDRGQRLKYPRPISGSLVFGPLWSILPTEIPVDRRGSMDGT